jgi:hypothetical protein
LLIPGQQAIADDEDRETSKEKTREAIAMKGSRPKGLFQEGSMSITTQQALMFSDAYRETDEILTYLADLCENIAMGNGKDDADLFELTKKEAYPEIVTRLAESFGMLLIKLEARELHTLQMIEDLKKIETLLSANAISISGQKKLI